MNNFLTVLSQLVVIAAGACFSGCAGFIRDHGGCLNERNADVSAEQESTSGAIDVCKGSAHEDVVLICDTSWKGWGPYRSVSGVSANFRVYAFGVCNEADENPSIVDCGLAVCDGCSTSLAGYQYQGDIASLNGKLGRLEFSFEKAGSLERTWSEDETKHFETSVMANMALKFIYMDSSSNEQNVVLKSTQHVFKLRRSTAK